MCGTKRLDFLMISAMLFFISEKRALNFFIEITHNQIVTFCTLHFVHGDCHDDCYLVKSSTNDVLLFGTRALYNGWDLSI